MQNMPVTPVSSLSSSPSSYFSRHSDPPPHKRRKVSNSNPHHTPPLPTPDQELDVTRRAASERILNIWSSLEQKYARRLDEDDIFDLRTVSVIEDRGVLRSADGFDFGYFSQHSPKTDDSEYQGTEQEEEDGFGGWGSDEMDQQFSRVCLPVRTRADPADVDDLQEFLIAEAAQRAASLDDNNEVDEWREEEEEEGEVGEEEEEGEVGEEEEEGEVGEEEVGEEGGEGGPPSSLVISSDESDDELAGYDDTVGEGAMLWEVKQPSLDHSQSQSTKWEGSKHTLPRPRISPVHLPTFPHSQSLPSTPRRRSILSFKTPERSNQYETTTLTPLTRPLSLGGTKNRPSGLSPTKGLIPEVLIPQLRAPIRRLGKGRGNPPSAECSRLPMKRKRPRMNSFSDEEQTVDKQITFGYDPHNLNPEGKPQSSTGSSTSTTEDKPPSVYRNPSPPPDTQDPLPSPGSPQEDKPQPIPHYAPPMPPYSSPHPPQDWGTHYRQNQTRSIPPHPTDTRIYIQAMHSILSFLLYPVQPWPYSLPASIPPEVPHPFPSPHQRTPCPVPPFLTVHPSTPNQEPVRNAPINDTVIPKPCLKKVTFSSVTTDFPSTPSKRELRNKSRSEQSTPTSKSRFHKL